MVLLLQFRMNWPCLVAGGGTVFTVGGGCGGGGEGESVSFSQSSIWQFSTTLDQLITIGFYCGSTTTVNRHQTMDHSVEAVQQKGCHLCSNRIRGEDNHLLLLHRFLRRHWYSWNRRRRMRNAQHRFDWYSAAAAVVQIHFKLVAMTNRRLQQPKW